MEYFWNDGEKVTVALTKPRNPIRLVSEKQVLTVLSAWPGFCRRDLGFVGVARVSSALISNHASSDTFRAIYGHEHRV